MRRRELAAVAAAAGLALAVGAPPAQPADLERDARGRLALELERTAALDRRRAEELIAGVDDVRARALLRYLGLA